MKDYGVVTVKKIWTKRRVVSTLLLIFICLFGVIALLTYYGQHVGSFTISMSDKASKHSIYLSTDPSFASYQPRLMCDSLENAKNVPYMAIKKDYVKKTNGTYLSNDKSYIGYTFYLMNMSEESISLKADLEIAQATKGVEDAAWIWFFQGEDDLNGTIYQKEDNISDKEYQERYGQYEYPSTTAFKSDDVVFSRVINNVEQNEVIKFTLILWLEGQDPDCNDQIVGGSINFNLNIILYSESDEA